MNIQTSCNYLDQTSYYNKLDNPVVELNNNETVPGNAILNERAFTMIESLNAKTLTQEKLNEIVTTIGELISKKSLFTEERIIKSIDLEIEENSLVVMQHFYSLQNEKYSVLEGKYCNLKDKYNAVRNDAIAMHSNNRAMHKECFNLQRNIKIFEGNLEIAELKINQGKTEFEELKKTHSQEVTKLQQVSLKTKRSFEDAQIEFETKTKRMKAEHETFITAERLKFEESKHNMMSEISVLKKEKSQIENDRERFKTCVINQQNEIENLKNNANLSKESLKNIQSLIQGVLDK